MGGEVALGRPAIFLVFLQRSPSMKHDKFSQQTSNRHLVIIIGRTSSIFRHLVAKGRGKITRFLCWLANAMQRGYEGANS